MRQVVQFLTKFIDLISLLIFSWIITLLFFFSNILEYACKRDYLITNYSILIIGLVLVICLILIKNKVKTSLFVLKYSKIVNIITFLLFFFQIYVCLNIFFETV